MVGSMRGETVGRTLVPTGGRDRRDRERAIGVHDDRHRRDHTVGVPDRDGHRDRVGGDLAVGDRDTGAPDLGEDRTEAYGVGDGVLRPPPQPRAQGLLTDLRRSVGEEHETGTGRVEGEAGRDPGQHAHRLGPAESLDPHHLEVLTHRELDVLVGGLVESLHGGKGPLPQG